MTEAQARALKVGDIVVWHDNPKDCGKVIDKGYAAFAIHWEDGAYSTISFQGDPRLQSLTKQRKVSQS